MKSARRKIRRLQSSSKFWNSPIITLKRKSFTLIELLIVIAILGVLAAAVLVAINPAKRTSQARDAKRKSDIAQVATALETYSIANGGSYPAIPGGPCWGCNLNDIANILETSGDIKKVPQDSKYDPAQSGPYHNRYNYGDREDLGWGAIGGPGKSYGLWAWLEDENDKDVSAGYKETAPDGQVYGVYMFVSGKKVP